MYELIQVSPHDYYVDCPAKIGLCRLNDQDVCLIDSASDKDAGRKAIRIITENGWHCRDLVTNQKSTFLFPFSLQ